MNLVLIKEHFWIHDAGSRWKDGIPEGLGVIDASKSRGSGYQAFHPTLYRGPVCADTCGTHERDLLFEGVFSIGEERSPCYDRKASEHLDSIVGLSKE